MEAEPSQAEVQGGSGSHVQAGQGLLETTLRFTKKPASAATGLQPVQFSQHIPKHVGFFL